MTGTVLILGANGKFGRAAAQAFAPAGWDVRAATRTGQGAAHPNITRVRCDAMDRAAVVHAAQGADVIVNALNPLYPDWARILPVHTANVIAAGLSSGATVMIPGNVYPFGENAAVSLNEADGFAPTTRKGALRVTMEQAFKDATTQGLRTIILRGGDYIEQEKSGGWFDGYLANKVHSGKFTYPGSRGAVHAWAYLPDMARAMVGLADKRNTLPPYTSYGFEGYSLTGQELHAAVEQAVGRPLKQGSFPWPLMRVISLFSPLIREVLEMRYLWDTPHRVDGEDLREALPDFIPTPLEVAMADVMIPAIPTDAPTRRAATRSA